MPETKVMQIFIRPHNAILKKGVLPSKSIISKLLLSLDYQTWYQIKAETNTFHYMVRHTMNLICIFVNINENVKKRENRKKDQSIH